MLLGLHLLVLYQTASVAVLILMLRKNLTFELFGKSWLPYRKDED